MRASNSVCGAMLMALGACTLQSTVRAPAVPASGVIGVQDSQLDSRHWIRPHSGDRVFLDEASIAAHNRRLLERDPSVHDLKALSAGLPAGHVRSWIEKLSAPAEGALYDASGVEVPQETLAALTANLNLEGIAASATVRYGLSVRRADLRSFPTRLRVFNSRGDTDIDRFQESALFPGVPVVIAHESRDHQWWFIVSPLYAAWVEKSNIAEGNARQVFNYVERSPYLVITGAKERTVFTPERPEVSELQLDMGVKVPLLTSLPPDHPVNGEHPYASFVIELPVREANGSLSFSPALLPRISDASQGYLPLSEGALLRQSFKFLGERYGWGHSYDARDCSGFVADVYRSFGVELPRNTRDQAVSPVFDRLMWSEADSHAQRLAALKELKVGDLIYIPGHVMMVIGYQDGMPYVIHDTTGINYRGENQQIVRMPLNAVSVTPLVPLLTSSGKPTIDSIYSILRIQPRDKT